MVITSFSKYKSIQIKWLKCVMINRFPPQFSFTDPRNLISLFAFLANVTQCCSYYSLREGPLVKKDHDTTQLLFITSIWVVMATGQTSNEQHVFCADIVFILTASPY